jgi:RHS repeat-associated protein
VGNVTQQIDPKGTVINYYYDALNRLTAVQFPLDSSQNIGYTYDSGTYGIGRITGRTDISGTYAFSYDARGNLTQEQKTISGIVYTTGYGHNGNNVLTSLTYPSGRVVTYTRDTTGQVSQVSTTVNGTPTTLASSLAYLPFGGITSLIYGNGLVLSQAHDTQYRISSLTVGSLLNLTYAYDANGNITAISDAVNPPGGPLDTAGVYTYLPESNKLDSIAGNSPLVFGYDANGNTTSETNRSLTYDLLNRLVAVSDNGTQYAYDASGQRIKKITQSGTRIFHYDLQGRLIAETTPAGSSIAEYIYLGDQLLATIRSEAVYYYHNDHLGTPRALTDASGTVVWKADYTPFGKAQISVSTIENPFRFPGQYYDAETGLHYNYHRYYQPETGRYVTPDPIGLGGGANPFVYVGNNPLKFTDPSGLLIYPWHFAITYFAAWNSDHSVSESWKLARQVAGEDRNALDKSAGAANIHGMIGLVEAAPGSGKYRPQTEEEALFGIINVLQKGGPSALHDIQDLPGHNLESMENFGPNWSTVRHLSRDIFDVFWMIEAYHNTKKLLKPRQACK